MQLTSDRSGEADSPAGRHFFASFVRVARRAVPNLLISAVGPAVCFIVGRDLWGLLGGVGLALLWNGTAQVFRIVRGQAWSALLVVGLVCLVTRCSLALAFHSARMYFIAPAVVTAVTGMAYVWSAFTSTPLVARMFSELVPPSVVDPRSPKWQRALRRGTILYGAEQVGVAGLSVLLVVRVAPTTYAAVHPVLSAAVFAVVAAIAIPLLRPEREAPASRRGVRPGAAAARPSIEGAAVAAVA